MNGAFVETMKMIKIEHSVFALPFALVSAFFAADGVPEPKTLLLIVAAMVFARSSAMAFNRYLDADLDAKNPRTAVRSIPAGRLTRVYALGFTLLSAAGFMICAGFLNNLALLLSPLVLLVLLGYSYTKRFTRYCHFVLGVSLGLAPLGAWVAVTGSLAMLPLWLGFAVIGWVAGFDIIYACQDIGFDRDERLFSIPAAIGLNRSLVLARLLHLGMVLVLGFIGTTHELGALYWIGVGLVALCLVYEHSLVWDGSLDRVDMAFFTMNGVVSLVFGGTTIASILIMGL